MAGEPVTRVVVTGATGFIGQAFVRRLEQEDVPVLAIVRRPQAAPVERPGLRSAVRDLERSPSLHDVFRQGDVIVHLAARAHVMRDGEADADGAYQRANVLPTRMVCESAVASGARRVVYLSSAKVFGEGREAPYTTADPPAPADAYARSKREAEQVVRDVCGAGGVEWTILRPPFVYGPGGKGNFPRLVALARLSSIIPLPLGSIRNRRSIVFVGNLVDAIARCCRHPAAAASLLLPTDACDVSTPELLRGLAAAAGRRALLFPCPPSALRAAAALVRRSPEIDRLTESLRLDSRHLEERLDWRPPFTLEQALALSVRDAAGSPGGAAHE